MFMLELIMSTIAFLGGTAIIVGVIGGLLALVTDRGDKIINRWVFAVVLGFGVVIMAAMVMVFFGGLVTA